MLKVSLAPHSFESLKASSHVSSLCFLLISPVLICNWQSVSRTEGTSQGKKGRPGMNTILKYLAELSRQFLHVCISVTFLKSVQCLFFFLSSSCQDSIKWLPKSPKLYSGHNWSSQGSRWTSLKGKEGFHGGNLYKLSSANGKWREGRISPEQEAEELEDPDEDEPISKFSGSLFDNDVHLRDKRNSRAALQDRHKSAAKGKTAAGTNSKAQAPVSAGSLSGESSRFLEDSRTADGTQPPLKGILITRLPKDCPADVAGIRAGERAAEGSLISEPNTHDAGPTETSSKGSPFQPLNHVITDSS
ncbi:uncharacterized protein LOC104909944 isoform X2 [Meleagris gallopavo]|uniref:uncharacterized protein LOC104909944 isoform X2 n=1 Tax=Meleagris gallopavo TaxID=9103 RepID=UPI0012AB70AD|nr:uncharacterized protein LOC104909944 isoform X2 [Meleagris gallopavo]